MKKLKTSISRQNNTFKTCWCFFGKLK